MKPLREVASVFERELSQVAGGSAANDAKSLWSKLSEGWVHLRGSFAKTWRSVTEEGVPPPVQVRAARGAGRGERERSERARPLQLFQSGAGKRDAGRA